MIARGWKALLLEPVPATFEKLKSRHGVSGPTGSSRLRLINGGVCRSCNQRGATMHTLDFSNASGGWGSPHADGRCARQPGLEWLHEIASLSRRHVLRHERYLASTPAQCSGCARTLGYSSLPDDCLRNFIASSLVEQSIACVCLQTEVQPTEAVSLLLVDAEGFDLHVSCWIWFNRPVAAAWS